jgi:type IV pilus assembly protein PilC
MAFFKAKAATHEGNIIFKEIEARSSEEVRLQLEKEGLYPIEIRRAGMRSFFGTSLFAGKSSLRRADFLIFNKGLISLLKAGLPVVNALETLRQRIESAYFMEVLKDTIDGVRGGKALSEAMDAHPGVFPPLYTATVSSGERTGDLVPAISSYVEYQKRMEAVRKKVVSCVTYPALLTAASISIIAFLITYVIPTFSRIYIEAGAELPLASSVLIAVAVFARKYFLLFVMLFFAAALFLRAYLKSERGALRLDRAKLALPRFGAIYRDYAVSKFSRTLAMVLRSGMHLIGALETSKRVLGNSVLEKEADGVIKRAKEGESVTDALAATSLMRDVTLKMFAAGEKSATLPETLSDIADFLDGEVDYRVGIMTTLIEPLLMVVMGLIIGTIVVLLYLPIFQLGARL